MNLKYITNLSKVMTFVKSQKLSEALKIGINLLLILGPIITFILILRKFLDL